MEVLDANEQSLLLHHSSLMAAATQSALAMVVLTLINQANA
jgi:hypothetical protein